MKKEYHERTVRGLQEMSCDGWLLYSFQGSNPIAEQVVGLVDASRPWFLLIDRARVTLLCQAIDEGACRRFYPDCLVYTDQVSLRERLGELIGDCRSLAMEYSPQGAIPYVSKVDAGTLELIRSLKPSLSIISSAPLIQRTLTIWDEAGIASHRRALTHLHEIVELAWKKIAEDIAAKGSSEEFDIQELVMKEFESRRLETNHPPIVAINEHAADPHYAPDEKRSSPILSGQLVMIDLWAREKGTDSIYADITWMGYTAASVPEEILAIWTILTAARDAGLKFINKAFVSERPFQGQELDRVIRSAIAAAGYGQYFIHRSGHSIAHELHAQGVNIDSYELVDTREVIPGCGFSVEPGIYIPGRYGFRTEIDVHIGLDRSVNVYGPIQKDLLTL